MSTPILGVWFASSLAAHQGRPVGLALLTGALLFPVLPLAWEGWAAWRAKARPSKKKFLTFVDRLVLRTLAVNLVFLVGLLAAYPQSGFVALATRGDWMLTGNQEPWAQKTRRFLFAAAQRIEWLYLATRDNPYERFEPDTNTADDTPVPPPTASSTVPTPAPTTSAPVPEKPEPGVEPVASPSTWPMPKTLHPAVATMPSEAEASIDSVARYLVEREPDPMLRVKAVHDYVADRVAYDAVGLARGHYPHQSAQEVFSARIGVCAGYANLFQAIGEAAGLDVVYLVGDARSLGTALDGVGHAWNAVRVDGKAYLIDVTWDAGTVEGETFTKRYETTYLFTPPEAFGLDHFPKNPEWQLRERPLTRGEFLRQPALDPRWYALGLKLVGVDSAPIYARGSLSLPIENPGDVLFLSPVTPAPDEQCAVRSGRLDCTFRQRGPHAIRLYASPVQTNRYPYVGRLDVVSE